MGASAKGRGGSFRDLRERHLPLFKESVHRHDRGWPHPESDKESAKVSAKKGWKTIGIFHFRPDEDEASQVAERPSSIGGSCCGEVP